jgi:hypothetical protein
MDSGPHRDGGSAGMTGHLYTTLGGRDSQKNEAYSAASRA